jgi:hypothetical protein
MTGVAVIGAGMSRTGTTSFREALHVLGFDPCYQMQDVVGLDVGPNAGHLDAWHGFATAGSPMDWARLFAGYRAVVNLPGNFYFRELLDAFPEARVVLTVRDPAGWATSYQELHAFNMGLRSKEAMRTEPYMKWHAIVDALIWDRMALIDDTESLIEKFHEHIEEVVRGVPAEKLLVFDVRQGWDPLCDFLAVDAPADSFPRVNEREAFERNLALDGQALLDSLRRMR